MTRILVLGGTGFVGRAVCERLTERSSSDRIKVPTRRLARGQGVQLLPTVDLVQAQVHDDAQLQQLVQGVDVVINLIAILHGSEADFQRVHVELPSRLVNACHGAGVKRLVHVSALGASSGAPSRYLRSMAAGEAVLATSGLDVTVLRPSVIFGTHDRFLNLFAQLQAVAPVMPLAGAQARLQPVWVEDVAQAIMHALDTPATIGQTFECAGPKVYTLSQLVHLAGQWSGHDRPQWALPHWAGWLQAAAMECLPGEPLMSRDNLASLAVPNVASGHAPDLRAMGITPTAMESVAPRYLGDLFLRPDLDRFRAGRSGR